MSDYEWFLDIGAHEGLKIRYSWKEFFYEDGDSMGYWGVLFDAESGEELNLDYAEAGKFNAAASAFRVSEIQSKINLNSVEMSKKDARKNKILEFFEDSQKGKYLGQKSNNATFYVQDAAELLRISLKSAIDYVNELIKEEKIGLNGLILIPYEDYAREKTIVRKETGHKSISISDFGWWSCSSCGKGGDDWTNPKDFKCEDDGIKPE